MITKVESPAMESGVKSGDILLAINNIQIKDVNDLMKILDDFADSRSVALLIKKKVRFCFTYQLELRDKVFSEKIKILLEISQ